jgi:hypothetical protein
MITEKQQFKIAEAAYAFKKLFDSGFLGKAQRMEKLFYNLLEKRALFTVLLDKSN